MSVPIPVAFYTPTKGLDDQGQSGERPITRAALDLLERAGFAPGIPTRLVTLDRDGDAARQADLIARAEAEADRVVEALAADPPALWYSYHSYYKCPDLIGPVVSARLGIPYVLQQPTLNPRHLNGPWARFASASAAAHDHARLLLWSTRRDLPALQEAGMEARLRALPPVVEPGPMPVLRAAHSPLRLLTVAMMPEGDKLESYRRLAAALAHVRLGWRLRIAGDGPARPEVEALFTPFGERVTFLGRCGPRAVAAEYDEADLLVWPGVGEGIGMVYLEAQAMGVPVIAEDHPAQRDIVQAELAPPGDARAFADLLDRVAHDRVRYARDARVHIETGHAPDAIAPRLRAALMEALA